MVRDVEIRVELFESIIVKLSGVVRDGNLRNSKLTNDVLPYKIPGVLFCDFGERFGLNPFCEVVYGNDQELPL